MSPRLLALLVALVPAVALAGCASDAVEPAAQGESTPVVVTSPGDYSYMENASVADAPHLHDYWGGADTMTVMDAQIATGAIQINPYSAFSFRPDAGGIVPLGTHHVEVIMDWTDTPHSAYTSPELWVKTAADVEPWLVGPLEKATPLMVESTNERNDLPHQSLSAWVFQLRVYPADGSDLGLISFENTVHVQARAHRGLDIPLFPAHPDHWMGATELPLASFEQGLSWAHGDPDVGHMSINGGFERVTPSDGAIVPPGAAIVEVTLTMGDESVTQLGLSYHGADTRAFTRLQPDESDGRTRVYRIPVAAEVADGPYAKQSLWEFRAFPEEPAENGSHVGSYAISARVLRSA